MQNQQDSSSSSSSSEGVPDEEERRRHIRSNNPSPEEERICVRCGVFFMTAQPDDVCGACQAGAEHLRALALQSQAGAVQVPYRPGGNEERAIPGEVGEGDASEDDSDGGVNVRESSHDTPSVKSEEDEGEIEEDYDTNDDDHNEGEEDGITRSAAAAGNGETQMNGGH